MNDINKNKKCKYCKQPIPKDAKICSQCGFHQGKHFLKILNILKQWGGLGVFISIGLLIFAFLQYKEAHRERIDAGQALTEANKLKDDVNKRANEIKSFQAELLKIDETVYFTYIRDNSGDFLAWRKGLTIVGRLKSNIHSKLFLLTRAGLKENVKITNENSKLYFYDLFEIGFIGWLSRTYHSNWIRRKKGSISVGYYGAGNSWSYPPRAEGDSTVWLLKDIQEQFSNNMFHNIIKKTNESESIPLPPGMVVNTDKENTPLQIRTIRMENDYLVLTITIMNVITEILDNEQKKRLNLSKILPEKNQWKSQIIEITFNAEFSQDKSFSEMTAKQHKWIIQMVELFRRDFDWTIFEQNLFGQTDYNPVQEQ